MGIEQTRTGNIFFNKNVPQMLEALEGINKNLERIAEKLETGTGQKKKDQEAFDAFQWADFSVSGEVLKDASDIAVMDDDIDNGLFELIVEEITSDADKRAAKVISDYCQMTQEQKNAVNGIFTSICGWSLATIIEKYVAKNEEKEAAWKGTNGYIHLYRTDSRIDDRVRYSACMQDGTLLKWGYISNGGIPLSRVRDQVCTDLGWTGRWEKVSPAEFRGVVERPE